VPVETPEPEDDDVDLDDEIDEAPEPGEAGEPPVEGEVPSEGEVPDGAAMFPEIPKELGIHPLFLAMLHAYVFLDGSDSTVVNQDASAECMEYIAEYVQRLEGEALRRTKEDMDTLVGYAKEQKWPKQYVLFLKSFLSELGLK
jgi:hypothetical protein